VPVNVLIVGGGSIGERHLRCFQQVGCHVGLCESNPARRAEVAEKYNLPRTSASLDEACAQAWDAAVICTPAHLHVAHALQIATCTLEWVFCDYAHQALEGVEVEDTVHLLARARQGRVMVSIALNQFMAPNENIVQLNGARGSAQIWFHEHRYGVCNHGGAWQWSERLLEGRDDLFRLQASAFLDAAAGKGQVACTLDEALDTLRVNLAALESAGERRLVLVPAPATSGKLA
jgi:predicted dehydrogenase